MLRVPSFDVPLVPGQRVLVLPYPDASGATLGWYGSVVSGRYPVGYRVLFDGREMFVRAEDLLAVDEVDQELSDEVDTVWIEVAGLTDDQPEIRGRYRRHGRDWSEFCFAKHRCLRPRWEMRLPASPTTRAAPALYYDVPSAWRLDLAFVFRVFRRLLGKPRRRPPEATA